MDFGVRTWTLRAPERASRSWIGRQPPLVGIGRVELAVVLHRGRERERLAAAAGAEIEHLLAGLRSGQQRGELRALVLDFDHALHEGRLGMNGRRLGVGRVDDAQPDRRPAGRRRVEVGKFGAPRCHGRS